MAHEWRGGLIGGAALLGCAWALLTGSAAAQSAGGGTSLFICTDRTGKTHTGAFPPAECGNSEVKELRPDGSVRRRIPPPETAEQRAAREAEEKRAILAAEAKRTQLRKDMSLLEQYASIDEIENARIRALADVQASVARSQRRVEDLRRERKKLESETEFYAKRDMPEKLKRALADNGALTRSEEKMMGDARAEITRINERYDIDRKRWSDLVDAGARPVTRQNQSATQ